MQQCLRNLSVDIIPSALSGIPRVTQLLCFTKGEKPPTAFPRRGGYNNKVPKIKARHTHSILRALCSNIFPSLKNTSLPSCVCKVPMPEVLSGTVNKAGKESWCQIHWPPFSRRTLPFQGQCDTNYLNARKGMKCSAFIASLSHSSHTDHKRSLRSLREPRINWEQRRRNALCLEGWRICPPFPS